MKPKVWISIWALTGIVVTLVLGLFDNIDAKRTDNLNILRLQHSADYSDLDYLFVGSSYVYSGIDPELFAAEGWDIYNLGSPSAGPYFNQIITDDYLNGAKTPPGTIMLLMDPMMFASSADNWRLYRIHRYLREPLSHFALVKKFSAWTDYPSLLLNSAEMGLRNIGRQLSGSRKALDVPDLNRGFMPSDEVVTEKIIRETKQYYTHLEDTHFDIEKVKHYQRYIQQLKDQGHEVILFEVPSHLVTAFLTEDYLISYEVALEYLAEADHDILFNDLKLAENCYRNIDHLNSQGAAQLSASLIEKLKAFRAAKIGSTETPTAR